jgi:hypothetical protein
VGYWINASRLHLTRCFVSPVFTPKFALSGAATSQFFPESHLREVEQIPKFTGANPAPDYLSGMSYYHWPEQFKAVYDSALNRYHRGERNPQKLFSKSELEFLVSIGCTAQELFDFIDDGVRYGEPNFETTLLTTAVRRDYFLLEQKGIPSKKVVSMDSLPPKREEVDGIAWLPRLIVKARVKLRGEMPADLMYGCGGDRPFLRSMNVELAEFLRLVWLYGDDDRKIIDYVKKRRAQSTLAGHE